jgi:uncharacterized protein with PIN domain
MTKIYDKIEKENRASEEDRCFYCDTELEIYSRDKAGFIKTFRCPRCNVYWAPSTLDWLKEGDDNKNKGRIKEID